MARHVPVLMKEVIEGLGLKKGAHVIDGTLGDGGHSEAILQVIGPKGRLLGIDADAESLLRAKQYLYQWQDQVTFVRDNFVNLSEIVKQHDFAPVNGILLDLGWSSPQFAERGRGFSFEKDEPLDMRYAGENPKSAFLDRRETIRNPKFETAAQILNNFALNELIDIFHRFGEEKYGRTIAESIVRERRKAPIERTGQLVELILEVYREKLNSKKEVPWIGGIHPATKIFQALRIAVNDELAVLESVLPQAIDCLAPGGRLAIISFHSLEDRIVKHYFRQPMLADTIRIITKKPIVASEAEVLQNPRSRSAKLRVVEKK